MLVPSGFGNSKVVQMEARAEKRVHSLMPATIDKLKRMGLWKNVQLFMMPDAYSEGKLHAVNQAGTSAADFTVSRGSAKNTVDNEGYIRKVPANYPSIDYSTGKPVLRTDQQAQNKLLYWKTFENDYWIKSHCTVDTNGGNFYPSPFKDDNGNIILQSRRIYDTVDSSAKEHILYAGNISFTAGENVSVTKIIKRGTSKYVKVYGYISGDNKTFYLYYNFDDDSIYLQSNLESYKITKLANGFIEISITATTTSNATIVTAYLELVSDSGNISYQGDGTGYIEIAYAQFNEGNATGVICPYDAAESQLVTRLGDVIDNAVYTGSSDEFVLFAEIRGITKTSPSHDRRIGIVSNDVSNSVFIGYEAGGSARAYIRTNGTAEVSLYYNIDCSVNHKLAIRAKKDDVTFWIDGTKVNTDTAANMPTGLSKVRMYWAGSYDSFIGDIKQVGVFDYLTDPEMEILTK